LTSGTSPTTQATALAAFDPSFQITEIKIVGFADGGPPDVLVDAQNVGPMDFDDFMNTIVLPTDPQSSAQALIGLLDGDTDSIGSDGDDRIETGAGNDTVTAGDGDDRVYKWNSGDLAYDGGDGSDWLIFQPSAGDVPAAPGGAVVDLTAGTGTNPFGGSLDLTDVENVSGVFDQSNDLRGNSADNTLVGGAAGGDRLRGEGGDDVIFVEGKAASADGGSGDDTLIAPLSTDAPFTGSGSDVLFVNTLDLLHPSENTGVFEGGTFEDFETISATGEYYLRFDFRGSNSGETASGAGGPDILRGRGGDDVLNGIDGDDKILGGLGRDTSSGGAGDDLLFVILGKNTLVFATNGGDDTVVGYKPGTDEFDLTAVAGLDSFDDLVLKDTGDDVLVDYGSGSFLLKDTDLSSVKEGDFVV
jgi:Ca2+-binding RTX toxin-like protein